MREAELASVQLSMQELVRIQPVNCGCKIVADLIKVNSLIS